MKYKLRKPDLREIFDSLANPIVLKNLCICLGLSLSILATSAGIPAVSDLYTEETYAATQFSDDSNIRAYSREAVESLVNSGGIKGYPDGSFKPSGTITRIEYLSMAMNAVDPSGSARNKVINELKSTKSSPSAANIYEELLEYNNDAKEIWGGKAEEIIVLSSYIGAGMFDSPSDRVNGKSGWLQPITRNESAVMLVACLEELGGEEIPITENIEAIIADWKVDMSPESTRNQYDMVAAVDSIPIKKLYSAGIVEGNEDGAFQPQYSLTREQAAQTIYRAVNKDKRAKIVVPEAEKAPVIENTTLNANDPDRRTAIAGDKFIASDGKTYDIVEQTGGVIMSDTPIALDLGRYMSDSGKTVKNGSVSDGTLDGIKRGAYYCVNPDTGQGMWDYQWEQLMEYYEVTTPKPEGVKNGDKTSAGLGNWCEMVYAGERWCSYRPSWLL